MITLIITELTKRKCRVIQAPGDADVDTVNATVDCSQVCSTTLVGEDTDLLILLVYYAGTENEVFYFRSDTKRSKERKVYNINLLKQVLGETICAMSHSSFIRTQAVTQLQGFLALERSQLSTN